MLCLVYNKHNVKPMIDKHVQLVSRLQAANVAGLNIDNMICACTMHAFCDRWKSEFIVKTNLMGCKILKDYESEDIMSNIITQLAEIFNVKDNPSITANNLLSLYNYMKESLKSFDELEDTGQFQNLQVSIEYIEKAFSTYEKMKRIKKRYDYVDQLDTMYKLLKEHPDVLASVQRHYDYIVADEIQDFTPLMMNILQLLSSDNTALVCVGDDDQSIYNFKGADIYNTLDFENKFSNGEVYLLNHNRRCRKAILDVATSVITQNTLRFEKSLLGIKDKGEVKYIGYNSVAGENYCVADALSNLPIDERDSTVVCYRERESSIMLTELLEDKGIPFYVISGYEPYTYELYKHIIEVLDLLEAPLDERRLLKLWKVLPVKKYEVFKALQYNYKTNTFSDDYVRKPFWELDFGSAMSIKGLSDALQELRMISGMISANAPMKQYFPKVYQYLCKYFWNYRRSQLTLREEVVDFLEDKVVRFFNTDKSYSKIFQELQNRKTLYSNNKATNNGVAISTFHSLKGLEFNNVFIIDMDNDIFPNFAKIDAKNYSAEVSLGLKECETRLYYVAVTRARNNLTIYYNVNNPSRYVSNALQPQSKKDTTSLQTVSQAKVSVQTPASINDDMELFDSSLFDENLIDDELLIIDNNTSNGVVIDKKDNLVSALNVFNLPLSTSSNTN